MTTLRRVGGKIAFIILKVTGRITLYFVLMVVLQVLSMRLFGFPEAWEEILSRAVWMSIPLWLLFDLPKLLSKRSP